MSSKIHTGSQVVTLGSTLVSRPVAVSTIFVELAYCRTAKAKRMNLHGSYYKWDLLDLMHSYFELINKSNLN